MLQNIEKALPPLATLASLEAGGQICRLTVKGEGPDQGLHDSIVLDAPMIVRDGRPELPAGFFQRVMHAYVTRTGSSITVERSGCVVSLPRSGGDGGEDYVPACEVLAQMNVDYDWDAAQNRLDVIVEARTAGPRPLTPSERARPYAKYWAEYWDTPFHLRADTRAWAQKSALYQLNSMRDPAEMLHIRDVRRLLDPAYRTARWTEGWTLFPDGTGVVCVKTEFPQVSRTCFQWWFAWHVQEDLRYMLWYPPAHYGISPTLAYRKKLADPNKTLFEKTHGGDSVHLVYESTQIDALSCAAARPVAWHSIPFHDPQARGFRDADVKVMERTGCAAICGGQRMLHFFAEHGAGTGGTLYTHFWFGISPDGPGRWKGLKSEPDPALIPPILNIAQHAVKEFSQLAHILPRLYREEGPGGPEWGSRGGRPSAESD